MPIQPHTSVKLHSARDGGTPDLPQHTEQRIWCTACGDEVAEPATHICSTSDDTDRNTRAYRRR